MSSHRGLMASPFFVLVGVALLAWPTPAGANAFAGASGTTLSVGVSTSSSSRGSAGSPAATSSSSGSAPVCTYTLMTGVDAPSPTGSLLGQWYSVSCVGEDLNPSDGGVIFVPENPSETGVTPATPPKTVAAQAAKSISLPDPGVYMNPVSYSIVNLATWLWIDPAMWHPLTASATAGGVTATATAVPESVLWSMGDGHTVKCNGPGIPYESTAPSDMQQTYCSYTYTEPSIGQPSDDGDPNDAAYLVTATITWGVTWSAVGASGGGTLPSLQTQSSVHVRVEQVESIGTAD